MPQFSSVQSLGHVRLFATPWIAACQASLSITNSWSSLRLTFIESVMSSSHLILCHPLLLLPQIPPSIRVFSYESTLCMRWPKYWSFSFNISPSNEYSGLISFSIYWLDLLPLYRIFKTITTSLCYLTIHGRKKGAEGLGARGEGDDRGWDGWMASLTRWTWVLVNFGSWWWTGRPGMLRLMGLQRVGHDWATDLIWSDLFSVVDNEAWNQP